MDMKQIVLKMLENWHLVVLMFFIGSFLKLILNTALKIYEVRATNKDTIKIGISDGSKVIEITSSNIKLKELQNLNDKELLELDFDKKKAS